MSKAQRESCSPLPASRGPRPTRQRAFGDSPKVARKPAGSAAGDGIFSTAGGTTTSFFPSSCCSSEAASDAEPTTTRSTCLRNQRSNQENRRTHSLGERLRINRFFLPALVNTILRRVGQPHAWIT